MVSEASTNQVRDTLEQLRRELTGLDAQWAQINLEREKIKAGIVGLERFLGVVPLNGAHNSTSEDAEEVSNLPVTSKNAFKNLSVVGAAHKYLSMVGRGQTNRELVDALLKGGLKTNARHPADTIRTMLQRRSSVFYWDKEARVWKLVEWLTSGEAASG